MSYIQVQPEITPRDLFAVAALYGVERADRQQAEAEVRRLQAEVANWQRKELIKGSCCADNQHRAEQAESALAAECIENTRLREAFVTMEKAYNEAEAAIAALKDYVCRELTVIEFRCDHERREHKTASELTSLYLDVKAWARREP